MALQSTPAQKLSVWRKGLLREITWARQASHPLAIDTHGDKAHGMIYAAFILGAISSDEYDRVSELTINATYCRRMECQQGPYTYKAPAGPVQEAAA
ncbi:hypothetical protein N878_02875 [Pseudomonas sp. EGD-AK9]|uniref:hypothetical protein n=1 Tax=Pseudomonas sp. EGD-AK9 TaxID=1386078 RepID=UPI000396E266|nr:hypothetical protein [Pseudomonas sp. EGD-AK9]ERI54112.1 hypothetical protein N878_02875 [Pseudomonas sp. EGD-AK9]